MRLVRGSGIGRGSRGGYGFPPDACDPINEDIAEIIKNLAKSGGEVWDLDILAVAGGVVIGIVVWVVVLKGGTT